MREKARQIEMFGRRFSSVVTSLSTALELAQESAIIPSAQTETKLGSILREIPDLLALYVKPANADSLTVFRSELKRDDVESIAAAATVIPAKRRKIARSLTWGFAPVGQTLMTVAVGDKRLQLARYSWRI